MMVTRQSNAALLKSRLELLESRLKELETFTREAREDMTKIQKMAEETAVPPILSTYSAPLAPRPPVVCRPLPVIQTRIKIIKAKGRKVKATKFTPEILAQIPRWVEEGLNREEIASRIGCSMNSLQVSCCKRGISLWAKDRYRSFNVKYIHEEAT